MTRLKIYLVLSIGLYAVGIGYLGIHFIYLPAAVACVVTPIMRSRERARWARWIFFTIAAIFLFVAVCELSVDFRIWQPAAHGRRILDYYLEGIRGFVIGCFFVLVVSGQFFGRKRVPRVASPLAN